MLSLRQVQNAGHRSQITGHMSQVTGHRLQATENAIKKVDTAGFFVFIYVSFPVTSQSGICLALTMLPVVLRVKELNGESYTLCWNLESSFSRSDAWAGLFKA